MADESIAIDIFIDADKSQQTLGDLRKGFSALEEELERTNRSTVEGEKRFKEISTAMAQTGKEVKNIELGFESLDSEGVASEMGSVAGAVGDVTTSVVLLGGESKTMEQFANTIQTAIGVSVGFKGAIEGISSARKLYNNVLKTSGDLTLLQVVRQKIAIGLQKAWTVATNIGAVAMKAFNTVMKLNPIGLIVIAVTALIAGIALMTGTFRDLIDLALKPFIAIGNAVVDVLQWMGLVDDDTTKKAQVNSERRAQALKMASDTAEREAKKEIEAMKNRTDVMISEIDREIARRQAGGEQFRDLTEERLKLILQSAQEEIRIQRELADRLQEISERQLKEGDFFGAFQSLAKKEQAKDEIQIQVDTQEESLFELELFHIEQKKIDREAWESKTAIEKARAEDNHIERVELLKGHAIEEAELKAEIAEVSVMTAQEFIDAQDALEEEKHQKMLKRLAEEDQARQAQIDNVQAGLDVLSSANDLFVKDEIKRDKIKKALAIGQLAIDTARAISSGIASAMAVPFPGNIGAILATVATVLANMVQAKQLLSSAGAGSVSLPSGGASAGGGANINPVSNSSTLTGGIPNPVVSVQEINTVSNKVDAIEQSATI